MAKYSKKAGKKVERAMHEKKRGKLKSGSGKTVKSREQAIAIGLSEARKEGAKVPKKKSAGKKGGAKKGGAKKGGAKKGGAKKGGTKRSGAKKGARKSGAKKSSGRKRSGAKKR